MGLHLIPYFIVSGFFYSFAHISESNYHDFESKISANLDFALILGYSQEE